MNFWLLTLLIFVGFASRVMVRDKIVEVKTRDDNNGSYEDFLRDMDELSQKSFWKFAIQNCIDYENYYTTQYSEYENENISHRLDQLYAERFEDPSSRIMKEVVFESPKLSPSYKLTLIETYQAHKSDFDEIEKNIESYSRKLDIARYLLPEYTFNGSEFVPIDPMRTLENSTMFINAFRIRLEFLRTANLKSGPFIDEMLSNKKFDSKYRVKKIENKFEKIDKRILDEIENSKYDNLFYNTLYVMNVIAFLLFEKNIKN